MNNVNAAKSKPFYDMLRKIIAAEDLDPKIRMTRFRKAGEQLLTQAAKGEEWAIKELANRMDGKAKQQVELSGADGESLNLFDAGALRHMDPAKVDALKELLKEAAKQ